MNKKKTLAGLVLFGSLWGFSECIIGTRLGDMGLPPGMIMTGLFALSFLALTRMIYRQPGMQLGTGILAGTLRLFNPFVGCHICSAIAIMAEGVIFELIWYKFSFDTSEFRNYTIQGSMGIISGYSVFIGGYIVTQILTPIVGGTGFFVENLVMFMPRILAAGLLPALIGGVIVPTMLLLKKVDFSIRDQLYYPATASVTALCWFIVIGNWLLLGA
jgi:hypothetical protein